MSTRAASTSDARKRKAEAREPVDGMGFGAPFTIDTSKPPPESLPPVLPNPREEGWVLREPGDVIEAGTRVAIYWPSRDEWAIQTLLERRVISERHAMHFAPPPVPRAPWEDISTDREKPTLAKVTRLHGQSVIDYWWLDGRTIESAGWALVLADIESVELIPTFDPSTHVPVDRALIERILTSGGNSGLRTLAALADGAEKGAES